MKRALRSSRDARGSDVGEFWIYRDRSSVSASLWRFTSAPGTAAAALPQLLRTYVTTAAICASANFQSKAGIAGAVGVAPIATLRAPCKTMRIRFVGSIDCRNKGSS
jgi:hypothetical protein